MSSVSASRASKGIVLVALTFILGASRPAMAADSPPTCAPHAAKVTNAFRLPADGDLDKANTASTQGGQTPESLALNDILVLKIDGLRGLVDYVACQRKALVLTLDQRPLAKLVASPPLEPTMGYLRFDLKLSGTNRGDWVYHLGKPTFKARELLVSVAPEGEQPVSSTVKITLTVLSGPWFFLWAVLFAGLGGAFLLLSKRSNILRAQGDETSVELGARAQYSLSRVQAAWWFFVVLGAFLLIGIVTGDFENSLNATALTLLAIGAGTAAGSATIDASQPAATRADAALRDARLTSFARDIERNGILMDAAVGAVEKAELKRASDVAQNQTTRLLGVSSGFMTDIVSDAGGVVFHRFQIVAWTLVLTVIFIVEVYRNLAMPEFSETLLGLQGLSALTYLSLKIPEAKIPKVA